MQVLACVVLKLYNTKMNYKIVDINGSVLFSNRITESKTKVELSNFSNGLYFIQLYKSNTLLNTSKISIIK